MYIYLHGKDTYRSHAHMMSMIDKFKKDRDPQGLNITIIDASTDASLLLQEVLAAPFLAERRMIVIKHLISSKEKELQQELLTRMQEDRLPKENVLIFWENQSTFRSKLAKEFSAYLAAQPYSQEFAPLEGAALERWIQETVKEEGASISRSAALRVRESLAPDMWAIHHLLDQLMAYAHKREITNDDVALFVSSKVDDNIFALVDACVAGDARKAFAMIQQQYATGEDAFYIFAMLLRQFRILIQIREGLDRDAFGDEKSIGGALGLHPFVVKKSIPSAKKFSLEALKEVYEQLLDFEIGVKTSSRDPELLLDIFAARLATRIE